MTDADGLLAARFAATRDGYDDSDWGDVLRRGTPRSMTARRWRVIAVVAFFAIALPTLALSESLRNLVGLGNHPIPDYRHAQLAVAAPLSGGRVARLWTAPSTDGGECEFITIELRGSKPTPRLARMNGGGACTLGNARLRGRLNWSFSHSRRTTPVISGRVDPSVRAARVKLRWHGGSLQLVYRNGYFLSEAAALNDPPFRQLPYDVIAYDHHGHIAARSRIPTSFLYWDWKATQPRLHRYRLAHGCDTTTTWRCKSR